MTPVYIGAATITGKPNRPLAISHTTFNSAGEKTSIHSIRAFHNLPHSDAGVAILADLVGNLPHNIQDIIKPFLPQAEIDDTHKCSYQPPTLDLNPRYFARLFTG